MKVFLSILESGCHKLHIVCGITLATPILCGWEALSTPRALTHTRITWAFSPMAPQIPSATLGSPLCHGVLGIPHGEVRDIDSGDLSKLLGTPFGLELKVHDVDQFLINMAKGSIHG